MSIIEGKKLFIFIIVLISIQILYYHQRQGNFYNTNKVNKKKNLQLII